MTAHIVLEVLATFALLTALAIPLGTLMARIYQGELPAWLRWLRPVERGLYRLAGVDSDQEMNWKRYAAGLLLFNLLGALVVYGLQRVQASLPLNPLGLPDVGPDVAFNTAVSFASNTNWQAYGGEFTMSFSVQMVALTVQNFVSAATGMAVLVAFVRGFTRKSTSDLGNFWVDLTRSVLYVLLPLSLIVALLLVSQGVVQTFDGSAVATVLEPSGESTSQLIALGPVASQVAIKQLGTNGGGFFNVNSAHPLENPTPLSNLIEVLSILLIPAALCFTFGSLLNGPGACGRGATPAPPNRQGLAIYVVMAAILIPLTFATAYAEQAGTPMLEQAGLDVTASATQAGGNMEGKETRFGIASSAVWAAATTAASNGSVNSMHDSYTPLGGLIPMWLMQLGEVVFGGVGSGLYGMLMYALIAVFVAGLMVGRTPEYLGKKVEAFEMKMASLVILIPSAAVLISTAIAVMHPETASGIVPNPGAHGFSEILYAFSSGANNNGSAFGGLTASGPFYTYAIGLCMLIGRYFVIIPVLALAGSMARKKAVPVGAGTLTTHGPLFVVLLIGTVLLVGALTFVPALALGPIVEHVQAALTR
ncbi:MAG: potassium-transporting ATPase subunit KdpA [Myxococcales bacterium]|nr:potassium-transporting ATPase subunit KdpA [Myxococcales bacterium]